MLRKDRWTDRWTDRQTGQDGRDVCGEFTYFSLFKSPCPPELSDVAPFHFRHLFQTHCTVYSILILVTPEPHYKRGSGKTECSNFVTYVRPVHFQGRTSNEKFKCQTRSENFNVQDNTPSILVHFQGQTRNEKFKCSIYMQAFKFLTPRLSLKLHENKRCNVKTLKFLTPRLAFKFLITRFGPGSARPYISHEITGSSFLPA
jgi:phage terminase large subunit-like protein